MRIFAYLAPRKTTARTSRSRTARAQPFLFVAGILTLASCSHSPQRLPELGDNDTSRAGRDIETIAILGTNDIHGTLAPQELKSRETDGTTTAPISYQAGGVAALAAYVNELRAEYGTSLLWLDGGDEYQGSIESNSAQGEPMTEFLNHTGLHAAAIGNHEFDYGASHAVGADSTDRLGALKARMNQAKFPYLSANIREKSTGALATDTLPKLAASQIFSAGRLKVGVIGLTTLETPRSTTGINVRNLVFSDLKDVTLAQATELRRKGADIVVITAHVGLKCERGRSSAASHVHTPTEPQGDCSPHDEMVNLLKSLPAGTVDAVVAGHSHQVVHHWVSGVPVIQGGAFGRYFNVIYLRYDFKQKHLLTDLTRIEGPVPVCPLVFQNQGDCNGERPAPRNGRGALVAPVFHGETIKPDRAVQSMLDPVFAKTAQVKKEVIAIAARPIEHQRFKESELGNLVTDAMRSLTGAPVALMNSGGIRAAWEEGPITYESVFRSLPFDNQVVVLKVTGKELKQILRIAESGSRGYFSVAGLHLRLVASEEEPKGLDLNKDGKIDAWEVNRILDLTLDDGTPVVDTQEYRLATLDFLINGGDDLGWIMNQIPTNRQDSPAGLLRDAVVQKMRVLAQAGPLNTLEHPLVSLANPRLRFEKPKTQGKGKSHGKRRRRHRKSN